MQFSAEYFAVIANSTLRMMTPLLYATLAAAVCTKVRVFNIAMEGTMTVGAFFAIVVNHYTGSVWLSVLAAVGSAVLLNALVAFIIIRLRASAVVVGMAVNTSMAGFTTYLLYLIFNSRGVYSGRELVSLPKINIPGIRDIPILSTVLGNLTIVDYLAFVSAILVYIFLYKTVRGYRVQAVGINQAAARSLGTPVERYQFAVFSLSGIFCGLAGCLLAMGTVTLFIENITSGRGYIAMAANSLGRSHPLGVMFSSFFFGIFQALGNFLQNTSLKTQITSSISYVATIVMLVAFSIQKQYARKKKMKKAVDNHAAVR
jgi:simple sugar transport system permease protein